MKKLITIIVCMLLVLSGCATKWMCTKPGNTEAEFKKDNFECAQISKTYGGGGGTGLIGVGMILGSAISTQSKADKTYKECMEIRGYTVEEKKE